MRVLIVYDSFFGNTEKIAKAIAAGFEQTETTLHNLHRTHNVEFEDVDILIVGSPTRKFSATGAIHSFLKTLDKKEMQNMHTTAFDTRISMDDVDVKILPPLVKLFGYAAEPIAKKLQQKGGTPIVPPQGFFVEDTEGPLKPGEYERAQAWGKKIAKLQSEL